MALDLSIFEELMQNPDFVNIILPLIFFTTMTFTILQFTLNKMGKENIPLTEKTNIIISLVFGFLATNNEDAVRFLVDHFNLILLLLACSYLYLILQKIIPKLDFVPIIVMLAVVVILLNDSILAKYESGNWVFAIILFFAILWSVYKTND
ncbi:MAG: hypothetical protein B6U87_02575 [Candidatus Aenigmarchaeota archaeon ex4484_52]|nr:MAG: hypothetical protein B6U87_02575 [Candidatus Aenigmarchaeota archaeon ex4484_52]